MLRAESRGVYRQNLKKKKKEEEEEQRCSGKNKVWPKPGRGIVVLT
jgi:hypothetical protein